MYAGVPSTEPVTVIPASELGALVSVGVPSGNAASSAAETPPSACRASPKSELAAAEAAGEIEGGNRACRDGAQPRSHQVEDARQVVEDARQVVEDARQVVEDARQGEVVLQVLQVPVRRFELPWTFASSDPGAVAPAREHFLDYCVRPRANRSRPSRAGTRLEGSALR